MSVYTGAAFATLCLSMSLLPTPVGATRAAARIASDAQVDTSALKNCLNPKSTMLTPTPGFDPLTTSDAELQARDFPPRPTDAATLLIWQRYVEKYLAGEVASCLPMPADAPPPLPNLPKNYGANSSWAGWVVHNATFTDSDSAFFIRPVTGDSTVLAAYWNGVNLGSSSFYPLIQGGVTVFSNGSCAQWTEAYPINNPNYFGTCSPNDYMYVHTTMSSSNGHAAWHVVDFTAATDYQSPPTTYFATTDGHAETIVERGSLGQPLGNFGVQTFDSARAYASAWTSYNNLSKDKAWIVNANNQILAEPTGTMASDGGFDVTWRRGT